VISAAVSVTGSEKKEIAYYLWLRKAALFTPRRATFHSYFTIRLATI